MALPKNPTQLEVVKAVNDKVSKTDNETISGIKSFTSRPKLSGGESILPDVYQQVEYIEASGTQYIDTGYTASLNTDIEIEFAFTSLGESNINVFGSRTGAYENDNIEVLYASISGVRQLVADFGNAQNYRTNGVISADTIYKVICNKNQRTIYDGNRIIAQSTRANTSAFTGTYNLYLFATNNGVSTALNLDGRFYNCKIRENNTLVRELIPCYRKSDNEIGMYDVVNDVFYTNAGTGTFTKGDNVVASSDFATLDDIPTKTSDLTNDSGFITANDVPTYTAGKLINITNNAISVVGGTDGNNSVSVGTGSASVGTNSVALGVNAKGTQASNQGNAIAIGYNATAKNNYAIAIGSGANAGYGNSCQIGAGSTPSANTFKYRNTLLVDSNGKIPSANLDNAPATDADYTAYIGEI